MRHDISAWHTFCYGFIARKVHRDDTWVNEVKRPEARGRAEQDHPMAIGTKTFVVAALMAIAAIFGSNGASNADPLHTALHMEHVD